MGVIRAYLSSMIWSVCCSGVGVAAADSGGGLCRLASGADHQLSVLAGSWSGALGELSVVWGGLSCGVLGCFAAGGEVQSVVLQVLLGCCCAGGSGAASVALGSGCQGERWEYVWGS